MLHKLEHKLKVDIICSQLNVAKSDNSEGEDIHLLSLRDT